MDGWLEERFGHGSTVQVAEAEFENPLADGAGQDAGAGVGEFGRRSRRNAREYADSRANHSGRRRSHSQERSQHRRDFSAAGMDRTMSPRIEGSFEGHGAPPLSSGGEFGGAALSQMDRLRHSRSHATIDRNVQPSIQEVRPHSLGFHLKRLLKVSAHTMSCRYSPRSTRTAVAPSSWRSWRTGGTPTTATPRCCRSSRRRSASWSGSRSASASTSRSSRRRSLPSRPTTGCRAPIQRRACASISISSRTRFARRILAERTITSACGCSSRRRGSGARSWSSDQDKASGAVLPFACGMAVQVLASALRGLGWRRGHSSLRTRLRRFQCTACLCLSPRRPLPCPAPHGSTHSQPPGPESR